MSEPIATRRVAAQGPWARSWGYARAVRRGPLIEVSGTTAIRPDGSVIAPGDAYAQTRAALAIVGEALAALGAGLEDVTRTRVFLRHIADSQAAGRAHVEVFGETPPASSAIGGVDLLLPELLVEVEATAFVMSG